MPKIDVTVKGEREARAKLNQVIDDLHGEEFRRSLRTATLMVERDAKILAPVDSGRLRGSIASELRVEGRTVMGVVGSNVYYAPFAELGTGVFVGRSPYFPPPAALQRWAERHGIGSGWSVAYSIYRRGGTPGKKFLQQAFEQNRVRIIGMLGDAVSGIVRR